MQPPEVFRALYAYDRALWARVWESVETLTEAQYLADIPYSHGSVRNQMLHVMRTYHRWLRGVQGLPDARAWTPDPATFHTREALRAAWDEAAQGWADYLETLNDGVLDEMLPGMGEPLWQVLLHVANHGTDHRAQVLRALHDFGAPTFDQDMIFHWWRG
jgi:uncharacterized damage-inducible protein DinB